MCKCVSRALNLHLSAPVLQAALSALSWLSLRPLVRQSEPKILCLVEGKISSFRGSFGFPDNLFLLDVKSLGNNETRVLCSRDDCVT